MLGFSAPEEDDPIVIGAQRREWLENVVPIQYDRKGDPLKEPIEWRDMGTPAVKQLGNTCLESDRKACAIAFEKTKRTRL